MSSEQEKTESGVGEGSLSSASGTRNQPGDGFENDIGLCRSLVNTSDSVSLFYYIVICKTDWNWKRAPKKCGPGPPTKMCPRAPHSLSPALAIRLVVYP